MPVFLCYDPAKRTTPWTQEKHLSMTREFTKRRIKYFTVSNPDELSKLLEIHKNEHSSIVLFPSSETQRKYLFDRYDKFNLHKIIFSHHEASVAASNFSCVMNDFYGDMELAISHLKEKGCKKIALFGVNMSGSHDKMRAETFKNFVGEENPIIFETDGKIYPCIDNLLKCEEKIDAIICINDFFAFAFMCVLNELDKEWHKKLHLLSFSNSILSSLCTPSLSSLTLNYVDGGKEVATIHRAIEKNSRLAYMHMVMKSSLAARETTKAKNPSGMVFSEYRPLPLGEIKEIISPQFKCMALEKLLATCDDTDLKIIHGLVISSTLAEISERLYLTRDTIKYRVKKFKEFLKFEKTAELSEWLKIWIAPDKLEEMIIKK